jgi:hypothetical protein
MQDEKEFQLLRERRKKNKSQTRPHCAPPKLPKFYKPTHDLAERVSGGALPRFYRTGVLQLE